MYMCTIYQYHTLKIQKECFDQVDIILPVCTLYTINHCYNRNSLACKVLFCIHCVRSSLEVDDDMKNTLSTRCRIYSTITNTSSCKPT